MELDHEIANPAKKAIHDPTGPLPRKQGSDQSFRHGPLSVPPSMCVECVVATFRGVDSAFAASGVQLEDEHGHVVVLGGSGGELVAGCEQGAEDVARVLVAHLAGGFDHALLAPLLVVVGHGFADAVGIEQQQVAGLEGEGLLDVGREGEKADDGAARFETDDLSVAQQDRRVVAGVDALHTSRLRIVGGKEERHPEGAYYLDWRRNGLRVRLSVGKNAQDALTQHDRKTFELNAANHGVELASSVGPNGSSANDGRKPLSVAVADFLEDERRFVNLETAVCVSFPY